VRGSKRARQLSGETGHAQSKGKEKLGDVEGEGEQLVTSATPSHKEKKRKSTRKKVRFLLPGEDEHEEEKGSTERERGPHAAVAPDSHEASTAGPVPRKRDVKELLLPDLVDDDDDVPRPNGEPVPKRVRFVGTNYAAGAVSDAPEAHRPTGAAGPSQLMPEALSE
jgi:hypothetical protein